ncbi:hypothetical protein [Nitrosomonas eutropha]|uniref:Uncharacterized protein n=2 Tax=Nitrosomonas eutropha TaxID=916 RepID=A0ABX5M8U4_9PROT|nr:hypothetical protein [Nitrosomonas eutropha]ABI59738.1 hypothetical protein Neut_1493 [Nitrosomonas eutropha C91]PXV82461.1 hypothetical protein C8R14_10733 [Nitrosomonas eutropha]
MTKFKADDLEIEELAAFLLGEELDAFIDVDGTYEYKLWLSFWEKFGVDVDDFVRTVNMLIPLINIGRSPITNTLYKGFSNSDGNLWLVKMKVEE